MAKIEIAQSAPLAYLNWIAQKEGAASVGGEEYPFYSDAWITGECEYGPYKFLNTVPVHHRGSVAPAIVLRAERYIVPEASDMTVTDSKQYHGSIFPDEIAALASLLMGVRMKAGGASRLFGWDEDPRGRPIAWEVRPAPILLKTDRTVVPSAMGEHSMDRLSALAMFPSLSRPTATVLIRAARMYQDALWMTESEPALSWLMLVSALETAANDWRTESEAPVERLKASRPGLFDYLSVLGSEVPAQVANHIVDSLGSTKKFVDFILTFVPKAPGMRPPESCQVLWTEEVLSKVMRRVYSYRSKALHDGVPFPAPMCEPPYKDPSWSAPAEKPMGLAASSRGGTWLAKDTPIMLNTFEYIVRNVLVNWWQRVALPKS